MIKLNIVKDLPECCGRMGLNPYIFFTYAGNYTNYYTILPDNSGYYELILKHTLWDEENNVWVRLRQMCEQDDIPPHLAFEILAL